MTALQTVRPKTDASQEVVLDALVPLSAQQVKNLLFNETSAFIKEHNAHMKWDHWTATPWIPLSQPSAAPANETVQSRRDESDAVPSLDTSTPIEAPTTSSRDPLTWVILKLGQWADVGVGFASFFLALMLGMVATLWIILLFAHGNDANAPSLIETMLSILVDMAVYPALLSLTCASALREMLLGTLKVLGAVEELKKARNSNAPCRHLHHIRTVGVLMLVSVLLMLQRFEPDSIGRVVNSTNAIPMNAESMGESHQVQHANQVHIPTHRALHAMHNGKHALSMWERCFMADTSQAHGTQNLTKFIRVHLFRGKNLGIV